PFQSQRSLAVGVIDSGIGIGQRLVQRSKLKRFRQPDSALNRESIVLLQSGAKIGLAARRFFKVRGDSSAAFPETEACTGQGDVPAYTRLCWGRRKDRGGCRQAAALVK